MLMDPHTEALILRCRAVDSGINDYFEEKRYLMECETADAITPQYLLEAAISLVLDQLNQIGITTKLNVDDILDDAINRETMFYIAQKFNTENFTKLLKAFTPEQFSEYSAILENLELPEDYFFELTEYFSDLFPLDVGWDYLARGTDQWFSNDTFAGHLAGIQASVELDPESENWMVAEAELPQLTKFLEHMTIRDNQMRTGVAYILEKYLVRLDKTKLMQLVAQYDKSKLNPEVVGLFAKWDSLTPAQQAELPEPDFLKRHHYSEEHHLEYWQRKDVDKHKLTLEVAILIVISLILDQLPKPKLKAELSRYEAIASPEVYEFMQLLVTSIPWSNLLGESYATT